MPWSPASLGSIVLGWWEARDLVGTLADADPVSSWSDKSSHGRTLTQATSSRRPTFRNPGRNGYPSIRGDGDDLLQNTSGSPFHGLTSGYISFVFSSLGSSGGSPHAGPYVVSAPNSSGGNGVDLGIASGGVVGYLRSNTGAVNGAVSALSWGDGRNYLAESAWDFSKASDDLTIIGGDVPPTSATVAGSTTAAALGEFNVFNFGTGYTWGLRGDLFAVLICNRPLTTSELADWRGYVCGNWQAVSQQPCVAVTSRPVVGFIGWR